MDNRKIIWQRKKLRNVFILLACLFGFMCVAEYAFKLQGVEVGNQWIICLVGSAVCSAIAGWLNQGIRKIKLLTGAAQKLRDCIYGYLRSIFEIGDAKVNVGLTLTIMDYYLLPNEKAEALEMAGRATTEDSDLIAKCGENIMKYVLTRFEAHSGNTGGPEKLSSAERKLYDVLWNAVMGEREVVKA